VQQQALTAVRIGPGRAPETATTVVLEAWEGPLGLLLALIEARRLDVMTVPLGALAEAYLEALAKAEGDRLGNVSAFVAVAGQLILIKSRELLPRHQAESLTEVASDEVDASLVEADLRERLLVYRAYRDAGARLAARAVEFVGAFRREPAVALATAIGSAQAPETPPLDPHRLAAALLALVAIVPLPEMPPEVLPRGVTLAARAAVIRAALSKAPAIVLQELLRGVRDRVVVAVTFLALLELMKRREIVVEQDEPFGPIVARRALASRA
jgi:segregation and condensation protein A